MVDPFAPRSMKRNKPKGLAITGQPVSDLSTANKRDTLVHQLSNLEIGVEFKLDLRAEDLEVIKELGHGNGGTVSKVIHKATEMVMARKVCKMAIHRLTRSSTLQEIF
jgi:mitogen-activated protein kinase kinase